MRLQHIKLLFVLIFFQFNLLGQLSYNIVILPTTCGCNGSASVTITSGISPYSYTLNGVPTSTNTYTSLCAGTYTLFVQDSNMPADTVTIFFSIPNNSFRDSIISKDGCNKNYPSAWIYLKGGTAPYSYTIFPLTTAQTLTLNNLSTGTYTLSAKDNVGCAITNTFAVNHYSAISNFSMSATTSSVNSNINFTNASQYASTYLWNFGDGSSASSINAAHTYTTEGVYKVELIAYFATCSDTSYKWLYITDKLVVDIPNVFTPNDDDVNDLWFVFSQGAINMHLEIYNRYGVKVFENKGVGVQWDGRTISGEPVPTGTYFYVLKVTDVFNNVTQYKGYITLLR